MTNHVITCYGPLIRPVIRYAEGELMQVEERTRNPFTRSAQGGRALSAMQLPWFTIRPPEGYGVLTMSGRRTGKSRRKCVRAIRRGERVYIVSIKPTTAWVKNVLANPDVRLRIRGGTFDGVAREVRGTPEEPEAREAYCETINPLDPYAFRLHRKGRPTHAKMKELHQSWFEHGTPLVVELAQDGQGSARGSDPARRSAAA